MSQPPSGPGENAGGGEPRNPIEELFAQLGISPAADGTYDLEALFGQIANMPGASTLGNIFGVGSTPPGDGALVNMAQLRDHTRKLSASAGPDPSVTSQQTRELLDADRLAELWLDEVTEFPQVGATPAVWSRAEWIENTLDSWQPIVEPIITSLAEAMTGLMDMPEGLDTETAGGMAGFAAMFAPMLRQMAGQMYQLQLAKALATLSTSVVTGSEIGFQLLKQPRVTLLASNVEKHFSELEQEAGDIRLHLVLREAARQRLFNQVQWLGPQLLVLVEHYARETRIDRSAIESVFDIEGIQSMTAESMAEMSEDLQGRLFEPAQTPEQLEVLGRLETLLALVEGWVDHVVARAGSKWMPNHDALAEVMRRRRGVGGPLEEVFQALVGLKLRPRRVRDAANLWAAVNDQLGADKRDGLWSHPDLLPETGDLDDPMGFVARGAQRADESELDEMDLALRKLLEEERGN